MAAEERNKNIKYDLDSKNDQEIDKQRELLNDLMLEQKETM